MTVPPLPKTAANFIWRPEHVLVAAGQKFTIKVANADYMQHNFFLAGQGGQEPAGRHHHHPAHRPAKPGPTPSTASTTSR